MKILLIVISTITLFVFTSCEKDEMGPGGTTGGGMENSLKSIGDSAFTTTENDTIVGSNVEE